MADGYSQIDRYGTGWLTSATLCLCLCSGLLNAKSLPQCLYVSSYHTGYPWSDGIEAGLSETLTDKCEITKFYLDSLRMPSLADKQKAGLAAYTLSQKLQPDVIITSDDSAAKFLIQPYLIKEKIPVVFSGINWSIDEYGLPTDNVTGMVEVIPLRHILANTLNAIRAPQFTRPLRERRLVGEARIFFIGSDRISDRKNLQYIDSTAQAFGTSVDSILTNDFNSWLAGFDVAQNYDLVVLGNNMGILNWDADAARRHVLRNTRTLSVTYNDWMMRYSVLGYTRVPEEQGKWAGLSALAILDGLAPRDIPIVTNRRFESWLNTELLNRSGLNLSPHLLNSAKKFD